MLAVVPSDIFSLLQALTCFATGAAGDPLRLLMRTVRIMVAEQGLPDQLAELAPSFP
jgi:hypothetical protein